MMPPALKDKILGIVDASMQASIKMDSEATAQPRAISGFDVCGSESGLELIFLHLGERGLQDLNIFELL